MLAGKKDIGAQFIQWFQLIAPSAHQGWRDESATQCHPERSEGSSVMDNDILRFAQDDKFRSVLFYALEMGI